MLRLDPPWVAPVLDYTHQENNESSIEVHAISLLKLIVNLN